VVGGDLVQEARAGDGVLHARRGDQHREEESERVGDDAPLRADDLPSGVDAPAGGGDAGGGLTLWASITQADGSASRPSFSRNSCLSRPLSWVNTPSSAHLPK
jgi:hypothetical protein